MKVNHAHKAPAHQPVSEKITPAQVKALGNMINDQLANNDVGIDEAQTAGTDITNTDAPRGTGPKAAALYEKWAAAVDPRTAPTSGASIYAFNLRNDVSKKMPNTPVWAVEKWDDKNSYMVLFSRDAEIGRGKMKDDGTFAFSTRKS